MKNTEASSFLSDDDAKSVIISALTVKPHTEDDLTNLVQWAEIVRMDQSLLDMVIKKDISVSWEDGEPVFTRTKP